jgi:Spy/CpxP family protein refolding chaperone
MSKWKISLYLTALFLAGVVTGSVVTVTIGRQMMSAEKMVSRWRKELETKLQLTPEQVQKIDPILRDSMASFGVQLADQMLISMSNSSARIRLVLTPDQQAKFNEIEAQQVKFVEAFKTGKHPKNN